MLIYRPNKTGTLLAAYLGACRVGYAEARRYDGWRWQLSLVHPAGGNYFGLADDEAEARCALALAISHWIESAGLQLKQETPRATVKQRDRKQGRGSH